MKYCITLVGVFFSFVNAMDQSMDFSNYHSLTKPNNMGDMAWLRALEDERNKADCLGNLEAFKGFSLEISATISGKYGISSRQATPEEQAELIYSITRTRHKFSGAKDILPRFYGVNDINKLSSDHQAHLAAVLTIDTLAAEAMGNEDPLNQWSEVKADQPVNTKFINDVKAHAKAWTKEPLVKTLEPAIDSFLQNSKTIALAHDVFSIFAPKITLRTIYSEMFSGKYRGWEVRTGEFIRPIKLTKEASTNPNMEQMLNRIYTQSLADNAPVNIYCCSSIAGLTDDNMVLEYVYDECFDIDLNSSIKLTLPRRLSLTSKVSPNMVNVLRRHHNKISEEKLFSIYENYAKFAINVFTGRDTSAEVPFLIGYGISDTMVNYADWLFNGAGNTKKNIPKALELYRDAVDLGNESGKAKLAILIADYAVWLFRGTGGVLQDMQKALEVCQEAVDLGDNLAKVNLPNFLNEYAEVLFSGKKDVLQDVPKAIEYLRKAVALDDKCAKSNLPSVLSGYSHFLCHGINGVKRDKLKAVEVCREAVNLGDKEAKDNLPLMLNMLAVDLDNGENGAIKNLPEAIKLFREAVAFGNKEAERNLSITLNRRAADLYKGDNGVIEAIELFRESASLGDENAKSNLPLVLNKHGVNLFTGKNGVKKDILKAIEHFKEATALDNEGAKSNLLKATSKCAVWFFNGGEGFARDIPKAFTTFRKAISLGSEDATVDFPIALLAYASWLFDGENGVERDRVKAFLCFREAAVLGDKDAKCNLAIALNQHGSDLYNGQNGFNKNKQEAINFFKEAETLGNEDARYNLENILK